MDNGNRSSTVDREKATHIKKIGYRGTVESGLQNDSRKKIPVQQRPTGKTVHRDFTRAEKLSLVLLIIYSGFIGWNLFMIHIVGKNPWYSMWVTILIGAVAVCLPFAMAGELLKEDFDNPEDHKFL